MKFNAFATVSAEQRNESYFLIIIMDDPLRGEVQKENPSRLRPQRRSEPSLFNPQHSC
jgi:hypothetical protein